MATLEETVNAARQTADTRAVEQDVAVGGIVDVRGPIRRLTLSHQAAEQIRQEMAGMIQAQASFPAEEDLEGADEDTRGFLAQLLAPDRRGDDPSQATTKNVLTQQDAVRIANKVRASDLADAVRTGTMDQLLRVLFIDRASRARPE